MHSTALSVLWQPGRGDGYTRVKGLGPEPLHSLPETITTLLASYTPIQNKRLKNIIKTSLIWRTPTKLYPISTSYNYLYHVFTKEV